MELTQGDLLRLREGDLSLHLTYSVAGKREAAVRLRDLGWVAMGAALFLSLPVGFLIAGPSPEKMAESNARALKARRASASRPSASGSGWTHRPGPSPRTRSSRMGA